MSGPELAAAIATVLGLLVSMLAAARGMRSDKFKHAVDQSTLLLTGYGTMVASLQAQITALEARLASERAEAEREKAALREEVHLEKTRLMAEFETEREIHRRQNRELNHRVDELTALYEAIVNRSPLARERSTDS